MDFNRAGNSMYQTGQPLRPSRLSDDYTKKPDLMLGVTPTPEGFNDGAEKDDSKKMKPRYKFESGTIYMTLLCFMFLTQILE